MANESLEWFFAHMQKILKSKGDRSMLRRSALQRLGEDEGVMILFLAKVCPPHVMENPYEQQLLFDIATMMASCGKRETISRGTNVSFARAMRNIRACLEKSQQRPLDSTMQEILSMDTTEEAIYNMFLLVQRFGNHPLAIWDWEKTYFDLKYWRDSMEKNSSRRRQWALDYFVGQNTGNEEKNEREEVQE